MTKIKNQKNKCKQQNATKNHTGNFDHENMLKIKLMHFNEYIINFSCINI